MIRYDCWRAIFDKLKWSKHFIIEGRNRRPWGREWEYQIAFTHVPPIPSTNALDVGGGPGFLCSVLELCGVHAIWNDIDGRRFKQPIETSESYACDFLKIPLGKASVDTVYCISTAEHLRPRSLVALWIEKIAWLLRPYGMVVFSIEYRHEEKLPVDPRWNRIVRVSLCPSEVDELIFKPAFLSDLALLHDDTCPFFQKISGGYFHPRVFVFRKRH